ncbi:hypothetical protein SAMN05216548_113131 [Faunimonas pinastri]|uniref:Divergent polysaccharide deacetylase family protein n=1 Tax=Faunimonas pinastri TaxID=1855383 RepID=A0A1H9MII3_9HYPH|nr:divergent polysaccharide deacetylase family protein [Faunimonas pinastri]SER23502.1 hypothetical protein SAMN05216548_113131 [Faunimonas pinastri]
MFVPVLVSVAALLGVVAIVWSAVVSDPDGGHVVAIAEIRDPSPLSTGSLPGAARPAGSPAGPQAPAITPTLASLAPRVPDAVRATGAPLPELVEQSAFGPLPKVASDGLRPMDAYARPAGIPAGNGAPRVVIVVGGLGLSQTGTQSAIQALPPEVTLAFAPYGSSLGRWVDRARQDGHELLLQVPLEPVGYPQVNPGQHTLLVSADAASNGQELDWSLGRIGSYVGVMGYLGGAFLREDRAVQPFLQGLASRGLFFLDDGSSPESRAETLGRQQHLPVLRADEVIDTDRDPAAIEAQLSRLEETARAQGVAVGVASAFPSSVSAIVAWIAQAKTRGVAVVPASAAFQR